MIIMFDQQSGEKFSMQNRVNKTERERGRERVVFFRKTMHLPGEQQ